jgi:hypothetical protein
LIVLLAVGACGNASRSGSAPSSTSLDTTSTTETVETFPPQPVAATPLGIMKPSSAHTGETVQFTPAGAVQPFCDALRIFRVIDAHTVQDIGMLVGGSDLDLPPTTAKPCEGFKSNLPTTFTVPNLAPGTYWICHHGVLEDPLISCGVLRVE